MKKTLSILMVIAIICSLTACANNSVETGNSTDTAKDVEVVTDSTKEDNIIEEDTQIEEVKIEVIEEPVELCINILAEDVVNAFNENFSILKSSVDVFYDKMTLADFSTIYYKDNIWWIKSEGNDPSYYLKFTTTTSDDINSPVQTASLVLFAPSTELLANNFGAITLGIDVAFINALFPDMSDVMGFFGDLLDAKNTVEENYTKYQYLETSTACWTLSGSGAMTLKAEIKPAEKNSDKSVSENPSVPKENNPSPAASLGEQNALNAAKQYLNYTAFSYSGLIKQLTYDGYTDAEATYAADNCGADWSEQAIKSAKDYLKYTAFSYNGLIKQLEYEGFSTEEATFGADNCNANWKEQAVASAKAYLSYTPFSKSELIHQLEYEGFSHEEALYGVEQNGY